MICKVYRDSFHAWLLKVVCIDANDVKIIHSIGIAITMPAIWRTNSILLILVSGAIGYMINRIRKCDKMVQTATVMIISVIIDI
jgi:hypothetical protein